MYVLHSKQNDSCAMQVISMPPGRLWFLTHTTLTIKTHTHICVCVYYTHTRTYTHTYIYVSVHNWDFLQKNHDSMEKNLT